MICHLPVILSIIMLRYCNPLASLQWGSFILLLTSSDLSLVHSQPAHTSQENNQISCLPKRLCHIRAGGPSHGVQPLSSKGPCSPVPPLYLTELCPNTLLNPAVSHCLAHLPFGPWHCCHPGPIQMCQFTFDFSPPGSTNGLLRRHNRMSFSTWSLPVPLQPLKWNNVIVIRRKMLWQ